MSDEPKPPRPDVLVGRKLPGNALWEQLQNRVQPLALEFCSSFFNNEMSYKAARKWLQGYGIKISTTALQGFYSSMDMRLRFASLQAAQSAETARTELPADIEKATRERIAQHKFELAFSVLGEQQRLQLIQIEQAQQGMEGNFALKKAKLELDVKKFQRDTCSLFLKWHADKRATEIATSSISHSDKIEKLGQAMFGEDWN